VAGGLTLENGLDVIHDHDPDVPTALFGVPGDVRGQDDIVHSEKLKVWWRRFFLENVQARAGDEPLLEGGN
jgi:hypothetical protein